MQDTALQATINTSAIVEFVLCIVPFVNSFTLAVGHCTQPTNPGINGTNITPTMYDDVENTMGKTTTLCYHSNYDASTTLENVNVLS